MADWTIFIVTDKGNLVPHWTERSRRAARERLHTFKEGNPGARFRLKKVEPVASDAPLAPSQTPPIVEAPKGPTSYKPEFCVQGEWCSNAQRFATEEEARLSASARFMVWTMPSDYRVSPSDDPVNYRRVDGRDEMINRD